MRIYSDFSLLRRSLQESLHLKKIQTFLILAFETNSAVSKKFWSTVSCVMAHCHCHSPYNLKSDDLVPIPNAFSANGSLISEIAQ